MLKLILASQSPRRRELMKLLGHPFEVTVSSVEETAVNGETPEQHVTRLSGLKAEDIGKSLAEGVVIGSDTVVVLDGVILEKPQDEEDAAGMLMRLQSRTHTVYTGYALYDAEDGRSLAGFDTTRVKMRPFGREIAEKYVATEEPMDKAGAYGIQGFGAVLIDSIEGCFFNVMGLPVPKLMESLYAFTDGECGYFVHNSIYSGE